MSAPVYILRDQEQRYLDTQKQWVTGEQGEAPFFTPHRDVALNQLFELTLHDPQLRGCVETCPVNARGKPLLQDSGRADLLSEEAREESEQDDDNTADEENGSNHDAETDASTTEENSESSATAGQPL